MRTTIFCVALSVGMVATAQEPAEVDRPEDRAAIAAVTKQFLDAFNERDAKTLASTFLEDGQIITEDGEVIEGRAAIEAEFADAFENPDRAKMEIEPALLKFLTADVAVEEGLSWIILAPGEPAEVGRYTVNYVKKDGKWLHAYVRDHTIEQPPAHNEHLKPLEWMIGDWVSEGSDAIVKTKCDWVDDGRYLMRTYRVERDGKETMKGTERVGWDPLTKRIRSWIFDSAGGFGETTWIQTGERSWTLQATGVSNEGVAATLTRVVTQLDPHRILWSQKDMIVGGKPTVSLGDYTMVQAPPVAKRP